MKHNITQCTIFHIYIYIWQDDHVNTENEDIDYVMQGGCVYNNILWFSLQ